MNDREDATGINVEDATHGSSAMPKPNDLDENMEGRMSYEEYDRHRWNSSKFRLLTSAKIEEHTRIFASMCPDEILDHYNDYKPREYYTTIMIGDISGFTDLTEKYSKTGKGGPSKLTEILNSYLGAMVQEILSHHGDVLKFSGDAFIVMWKVQEETVMKDIALEAIQTACVIQKHFGSYNTDVGVVLKVKLAISSGRIFFTSIGDPENLLYYMITGNPVWDVKAAQGLCRGGDIIVAPSTWQWANTNEYIYKTLPDGIHTLILATTATWEPPKERYQNRDITSEHQQSLYSMNSRRLATTANDKISEPEGAAVMMNLTGVAFDHHRSQQVDYSFRPKVDKVAKAHMKNALRPYMIKPVIRSVEMDEPIEYLTEMRQVVILFVNVITNTARRKLIRLVDKAYKIVCRIVGDMQGCVNKTSLFDKDLMFLCVFGLRGAKHELQSQIGLRCAAKIRSALSAKKHVKSVTIGVTTGMTYCGVVGHILRREYTVIGMAVNKAARLMCAYSDCVVCDRESFLHSRLEARHFVLQEAKTLKGITKVGPIYEFKEQTTSQSENVAMNKYPLLGREEELAIFQRMLVHVSSLQEPSTNVSSRPSLTRNTLIIKGEPRAGKTRLIDEMIRHIPATVSYNRLSLLSNDSKSPYTLIHLIFSMPLRFATASSAEERENRILAHLGKIHSPQYLCSLNQVFSVNFVITSRYSSLSSVERQEITRKFIRKLVLNAFKGPWVVVIDDAEFSDEESLNLLPTIVNLNLTLFVMAFGQKVSSEFSIPRRLLEIAEVIELVGLDKWYHAGLACQILGLQAISAELEKVIQEKSLGNPGWVESYLISLLQTGGLVIKRVNKNRLNYPGLVYPPAEMVKRSPSSTLVEKLDEAKTVKRVDCWRMYKSSYTESPTNLMEIKTRDDSISSEDTEISIGVTTSTFALEDTDAGLTMDVMILKIFDSFSPLDQLLLKCAAILGETFNRQMLESFLKNSGPREIALAVKRLFEMRVLGCAAGDFKRSPGLVFFLRNLRYPNDDMDIRCACSGIAIPEVVADLPRYASCGLMSFMVPMFRDTIYRLLTEIQKVELHEKALKYLYQKTRRCTACGSGRFVKLLGMKLDEISTNKKTRSETISYLMNLTDFPLETQPVNDEILLKEGASNTVTPEESLKTSHTAPRNATPTFSSVDFTNCQCNLILATLYTQVLEHCRGIGDKRKLLIAIFEFVEVCLSASNIPQARKLLDEAEETVELLRNNIQALTDDEALALPFLAAKIKTLQGRCFLATGQMNEADHYLKDAMRDLGYDIPQHSFVVTIKAGIYLEYQKSMFNWFPRCTIGIAKGYAADFSDQLANCLAQLFVLFRAKEQWQHSHLAAIWGLNAALKSNQDFFVLCTSYAHMMMAAHHFKHKSIIPALENHALNVCRRKRDAIELQELRAVTELYAVIFYSRLLRGESNLAMGIGYPTYRMCRTVNSTPLKLVMLPMLLHLSIAKLDHGETVSMLHELEITSFNDMDKSARTWYYAISIDFQLSTALTVIPFRRCERYYHEEGDTILSSRDPEAARRYFTSLWLWCVRNDDWEAAMVWKNKTVTSIDPTIDHSFVGTITAMKKLEGLLILYVHKLETRNARDITSTHAEIRNIFKEIRKTLRTRRFGLERFALLNSYYHLIRFHTHTGMKYLEECKKISSLRGNKLILQWAEHCERVWTGSINVIQRDFWKEHCTLDAVLDWHEVDMNSLKIVPFSLPLPRYPY